MTGKGVREIGGIGIREVWERQVVMGVEGQGRGRKERKKKERNKGYGVRGKGSEGKGRE